jgi:hypothetical protein
MWYVMTIRHEAVYQLEQNVRMAPLHRDSIVTCVTWNVLWYVMMMHNEIAGVMWYVIMIRQ